MLEKFSKIQILSRNTIKYIAMLSMLCDHIAVAFLEENTISYIIMRDIIGRIAFPLFTCLLLEGFIKTKNPLKHIKDFLIFALLSEIVFDYVLVKTPFDWSHQNVMWTWLLCYIMLYILQQIDLKISKTYTSLLSMITITVISIIAYIIKCDYSIVGTLTIAIGYYLYLMRDHIKYYKLLINTLIIILITITTLSPGCLLAIPIILLYNQNKLGNYNKIIKYLFYIFYPAHLAILTICILYFK